MSGIKCTNCSSTVTELDLARGISVCTDCGTVLENNLFVAEVEFHKNANGATTTLGQFVSIESRGGATGFGKGFYSTVGVASKEKAIRRARQGITALGKQLNFNQHLIDVACNVFKMALAHTHKRLTHGRPATQTQAACVYLTCRMERTPHLLIDISDALHICCYQLGRTFFSLSKALCIKVSTTDPCLYILRFASQLRFKEKTHQVTMTALRLVQRMKRDSINSGRRPSGICGAALLIAARLHNFSRTLYDVVKIMKIHPNTLRKRLSEFGETPSSSLTLDEFMTVDLEQEEDPPAFKAARKKDKKRLQKLMEEENGERELSELQRKINMELENDTRKKRYSVLSTPHVTPANNKFLITLEKEEAARFAREETLAVVDEITGELNGNDEPPSFPKSGETQMEAGLGPEHLIFSPQTGSKVEFLRPEGNNQFYKNLTGDDLLLDEDGEDYCSSFILTEEESRNKLKIWNKNNESFLKEQKIKEENKARIQEEMKRKKVRSSYRRKVTYNAAKADVTIEKMLAEKRVSSKINYDILKRLDNPSTPGRTAPGTPATATLASDTLVTEKSKPSTSANTMPPSPVRRKRRKKYEDRLDKRQVFPIGSPELSTPGPSTRAVFTRSNLDDEDDLDDDVMETRSTEMHVYRVTYDTEEDYYEEYD